MCFYAAHQEDAMTTEKYEDMVKTSMIPRMRLRKQMNASFFPEPMEMSREVVSRIRSD